MAFLDKKTRVIDMQLTARGRELLATNQLNITSYAFSDEMIDYSGSLDQALKTGQNIDTVVFKNYLALQADQMDSSGPYRDLTSFLYTAPEQRDVLPVVQTSVSSAILMRSSEQVNFADFVKNNLNGDNGKFVVLVKMDDTPDDLRQKQYIAQQNLEILEKDFPTLVNLTKR